MLRIEVNEINIICLEEVENYGEKNSRSLKLKSMKREQLKFVLIKIGMCSGHAMSRSITA